MKKAGGAADQQDGPVAGVVGGCRGRSVMAVAAACVEAMSASPC